MGLLAKHDARVQAAKEENAATNQAVAAMDSDIKTIFNAANAGVITESAAMSLLQDVWLWYWQFITPIQMGSIKGNHCSKDFPNMLTCFADSANPCSGKACTAGCCLGCNSIGPSLSQCYQVFANHGGTANICFVGGSKYGGIQRNGYSVTYKPPASVVEAEATINKVSGLIAVGVPPTQNDVVVASGGLINSSGQVVPQSILGQLSSGTNKYFLIGGLVFASILVALGGRSAAKT